jgi:HAD superfamily hydrolase (TIGR01509 family)
VSARLPVPSALLFDLDGTLVDTVHRRIEAWTRAFGEAGIPSDERLLAPLMGSDGKWLARQVAARAGQTISEDDAEALDRQSGEAFSELNVDPRPLPGVTDLLRALDRAGLRWAIATSSRPEQVEASVRALGLPRPPRIIDASHVAHAKPAPDLLLAGATQLDVPPSRTWYVGDSTWDMEAACAARMTAVAVTSGVVGAGALWRAGADLVVPGADAVTAELGRLDVLGR